MNLFESESKQSVKNERWTDQQILQALAIYEETVRRHLQDWLHEGKLKPENGSSIQKLTKC